MTATQLDADALAGCVQFLRSPAERLAEACQCGATLVGNAHPFKVVVDLADAFWNLHKGAGHGKATFTEARNARRRQDHARWKVEQDDFSCSACGEHLDPNLADDGHDPQCGYLADARRDGTEGRQ